MKTLLIAFTIFCFSYVNSQIINSSCSAPDSIINQYNDDAATLALRRIYDSNSTYQDSSNIPQPYIDTVLNALIAVHNAIALPARDTVISLNIHARKNITISSYEIKGDTNLPWMQNLLSWNISSGHSQLDAFNWNHQFYISSIFNLSWTNDAWIRFKAPNNYYNVVQLIEPVYYFSDILGVSSGAPQAYGDGHDITHEVFNDHVQLNYFYKWGDCPAGCTAQRKWTFKVYYDCSVEYMGSSGSVLFPTASIKTSKISNVTISPNPSSDIIAVGGIEGLYNYSIKNMRGETIQRFVDREENKIDISNLKNGQYILIIQTETGMSRNRIIKCNR